MQALDAVPPTAATGLLCACVSGDRSSVGSRPLTCAAPAGCCALTAHPPEMRGIPVLRHNRHWEGEG